MWLLYVSCAWVSGLFLGSWVELPQPALLLGLLPLPLILLLPGARKTLIVTGLCLLALIGGSLLLSTSPAADEGSLSSFNDRGTVEVQGTVSQAPEVRTTYCLLTVTATDVTHNDETLESSGKALIRVPRYPVYSLGDVLRVTGELRTPPVRKDFDYGAYLADRGIHSIMYFPYIEVVGHSQAHSLQQWLNSLRERLSTGLARALPEPQASLAQGILLGVRENIPDSLRQAFSRTGTAHLLAISGMHVGVIVAMLLSLGVLIFGRQRSTYIWVALAILWLYVLLVGVRPPILRAAIMGSLFLLAEVLGRQRSAIIALAFAAAVMTGIQPHLLWSVSFQLSFAAIASLVLLFPHLQAWGRRGITIAFGDRAPLVTAGTIVTDLFSASLAAIAGVWPIIAYNFRIISTVGLPATFFALPSLPFIIVTSALVAFSGLFSPIVAQVLGWPAWLFLSYLLFTVRSFDAIPHASIDISALSAWHVWVYYAILATFILSLNHRDPVAHLFRRLTSPVKQALTRLSGLRYGYSAKWLVLPLLIVTVLIWSAVFTLPDNRLHVVFLDVGQGDAALIRTHDGRNILIDGGPDPQRLMLALGEKLPFWDRKIDLVVCTQPQADHITGLLEVLRRYDVSHVLEPGVPYDSSVYREWLRIIEDKDIKYSLARAGQTIDLGNGVGIEVLNPPAQFFQNTSCDVDNNGIVLKLTWNRVSFLFTADIREEAEFDLIMQRADLRSTVLKVSHHGSMTSTLQQFLAAVNPELAVISVGAENRFGHPSPAVVNRLTDWVGEDRVYRTDRHGTVHLITDGERLWVDTGTGRLQSFS